MIEWETETDNSGKEIQFIELDAYSEWPYRVDEWEYRYGYPEYGGVYFQTEIGAIAYAEEQLRAKGGRFRVVKL